MIKKASSKFHSFGKLIIFESERKSSEFGKADQGVLHSGDPRDQPQGEDRIPDTGLIFQLTQPCGSGTSV